MAKRTQVYPKRTYDKEEKKNKKLRRKYEEAKREIKRLRNILKRVHPDRFREAMECSKVSLSQQDATPAPTKPRCERCGTEDIKTIEINRLDGLHEITICQSINCGYKTPMKKVADTDSKNNCDNDRPKKGAGNGTKENQSN